MMGTNASPARRRRMNSNSLLLLITIVLFVVMYAAGCMVYAGKNFHRLQTFLNILITNAGLICVTCGMTVVMLTGGIDISVGALIAMESMFLAVGIEQWGMPAWLLLVLMIAIGVLFGLVQGYCVGYLGIQPFIVTMAGMFFARGMTAVISTQQISIQSSSLMTTLSTLKLDIPFGIGAYANKKGILQIPYVRIYVIIALLVVVASFLILRYTRFGRSIYAVGGNQQSASLMGLNVKATRMKAYVMCSVLCSIGAICYVLNTMCGTTTQALGLEMDAISSAVIGGTLLTGGVGNVIGSVFGVLINGTISSLVKTNGKLISSWANVVTALLLCFFIVLQAVFAKVKKRSHL
ncbi:MAG: sugar ABC transporter permease YjfF [Eubacteriales bacterium]|nr:sugar ABC transporter permease YjfF [Eubacteriales bacterium]